MPHRAGPGQSVISSRAVSLIIGRPKPDDVQLTKLTCARCLLRTLLCAQDPLFRGAYSYIALGSSPDDMATLAEPLADVLFFAGEATCKEHAATVRSQGAGVWGCLTFMSHLTERD